MPTNTLFSCQGYFGTNSVHLLLPQLHDVSITRFHFAIIRISIKKHLSNPLAPYWGMLSQIPDPSSQTVTHQQDLCYVHLVRIIIFLCSQIPSTRVCHVVIIVCLSMSTWWMVGALVSILKLHQRRASLWSRLCPVLSLQERQRILMISIPRSRSTMLRFTMVGHFCVGSGLWWNVLPMIVGQMCWSP